MIGRDPAVANAGSLYAKKSDIPSLTVQATKTASYTIAPSDKDSLIRFDATSGAISITLNTGSLDNIGDQVTVARWSSGANNVTVVAGTATVRSTPGLNLRAQYSAATIIKVASTEYLVSGDTTS